MTEIDTDCEIQPFLKGRMENKNRKKFRSAPNACPSGQSSSISFRTRNWAILKEIRLRTPRRGVLGEGGLTPSEIPLAS
jgi:hypothetical protein